MAVYLSNLLSLDYFANLQSSRPITQSSVAFRFSRVPGAAGPELIRAVRLPFRRMRIVDALPSSSRAQFWVSAIALVAHQPGTERWPWIADWVGLIYSLILPESVSVSKSVSKILDLIPSRPHCKIWIARVACWAPPLYPVPLRQ